jgi:RNA polymerase sigma-70 factor, ECF subfamily
MALTALRSQRAAVTDASLPGGLPLVASAVADVHDRRGRELFGLCRRLGLDEDEANDAVQEAFLRMLAESSRGTIIMDPDAWAFRVVYRLAMDHHRLGRAVRLLVDRMTALSSRPEPDPTDRLAVWAAVDRLPPRQRAVIYLRYRADLPFERIATIMGITANGARNDASAATASLRRQHQQDEGLR